jgi:hypothetical protein
VVSASALISSALAIPNKVGGKNMQGMFVLSGIQGGRTAHHLDRLRCPLYHNERIGGSCTIEVQIVGYHAHRF